MLFVVSNKKHVKPKVVAKKKTGPKFSKEDKELASKIKKELSKEKKDEEDAYMERKVNSQDAKEDYKQDEARLREDRERMRKYHQ